MILAERYHYPASFEERSRHALERALATASAYAPWRELDPGAGVPTDERYDALPALTKQMIRDSFPDGLAPDGRSVAQGLLDDVIEYTYTSGTTSERVINVWDQAWWDAAERAAWQLNSHLAGLSYPQKEAKLASSLNVGISCEEDLPMSSRIVGHRLFLNEKINLIQWMPRHYARMAAELHEWQPVLLEANPSLLARLAYWAVDNGVAMHSPAAVVYSYEFISGLHRAVVDEVFKAPQISSYGTTETGFVLQECEAGLLHQNLDFCRIDFYPLAERFGGPELGRILVTTFQNPWNAVVRFEVGDLVRLYPSGSCPCGRSEGMIVAAVEGRTSNCTFTTDGELVTTMGLDRVLAPISGLRDYHLEQDGPSEYRLELMVEGGPDGPAAADVAEQANQALVGLYGANGRFEVQVLDNILPGPAGKFRRTQANFEFDERSLYV